MLDPALWKPLFTVVYNYQERAAFDLRWLITGRLTRIDAITHRPIKDTWNKAGDLDRLNDGFKIGASRYIPWGTSYQVWPADSFYPFNLKWKPVPWFPQGKVQFWEYTGILSKTDLLHYLQLDSSNSNSDLIVQIELLRQQVSLINPVGSTNKQKVTDFLPSDNSAREMVAANPDRNGGIIFNKATKNLWVVFGGIADKGSPNKLAPGGQLDIPSGFTGAISGIFDAADTTPGAKAQVEEMING